MSTDLETDGVEEAVEFLQQMCGVRPRHLVTISMEEGLKARTFDARDDEDLKEWLAERQGVDNLYFHVNVFAPGVVNKKASKEDIVAAEFLHVDIDDPKALDRVRAFTPKPSIVVFSGGGYHAYWRLKDTTDDLDRVEAINMEIAHRLGGDHCHNVDRIMRLPGTENLPDAKKRARGRKPAMARVVEADWARTYTLDDFPEGGPTPASPKGAVAIATAVSPVDLSELPPSLLPLTRLLIEQGDDPERPRSGSSPRYRSRSEVVFRVACDLARLGCSAETVAGILINPAYAISQSILEKRQPATHALRQAIKAAAAVAEGWPDCTKAGRPKPTLENALLALRRLGFCFAQDLFRHRKVVNGSDLGEHQGEISDDAYAILRASVMEAFGFDPRSENIRDAVTQLCLENSFHPVRQMLDTLTWDGELRLDDWIIRYMGADDTPLNRAIGALLLVAAVRRVREPRVKFDTIVVFEGVQGTGKSTALQVLAGPDCFSDNEILSLDTKAQMEAMEGIWIYELSELSGLNRSEGEKTKAFATRQVDRARMSYARYSEERRRQTVFVGTTNESKYLKDRTGNRRFLPVKTGVIDLDALRVDRDQLWAEAAQREAKGTSITLPPDLWSAAAAEQEERLEEDPWLERLTKVQGLAFGEEVRVSSTALLATILGIDLQHQHSGHAKRLTALMKSLGWEAAKFKIERNTVRGFRRPKPDGHEDDVEYEPDGFTARF